MEKEQKSVLENYQQEMESYKSVEPDQEKKSDSISTNDVTIKDSSWCLGCLKFGCVGLGIIIAIILVLGWLVSWFVSKYAYTFVENWTSTQQYTVPTAQATNQSYEEIIQKIESIDSPENTGVVKLNAAQINYVIQNYPRKQDDFIDIRNTYVVLTGDTAQVEFGIPFPMRIKERQRYVNGMVIVRLSSGSVTTPQVLSGLINDKPLQGWWFDMLSSPGEWKVDDWSVRYIHDGLLYIEKK